MLFGEVIPLTYKNLSLGLDVSKMGVTSHTKVWVKCLECNEEVFRERKHINSIYNCQILREVGELKFDKILDHKENIK